MTPLHIVQRSWPHLRKSSCVCRSSGLTRPHTDAATTLRVCILVECFVTLAVLDFLCKKKGERHFNIPEMAMNVLLFLK